MLCLWVFGVSEGSIVSFALFDTCAPLFAGTPACKNRGETSPHRPCSHSTASLWREERGAQLDTGSRRSNRHLLMAARRLTKIYLFKAESCSRVWSGPSPTPACQTLICSHRGKSGPCSF